MRTLAGLCLFSITAALLGGRQKKARFLGRSRHFRCQRQLEMSGFLPSRNVRFDSIGGADYEDVGLGLVGHWARATVGLQGTYEHLPGIDAVAEQAQVEAHITPEASLFATAIWQQENVFADFLTGGLGLRLFPVANVRVDGGVRLTHTFAAGTDLGLGPYWAFEWQLPFGARTWQLSVFAEKQLSSIELAGVRFAWDLGQTLRDVARRTGWMRLR